MDEKKDGLWVALDKLGIVITRLGSQLHLLDREFG